MEVLLPLKAILQTWPHAERTSVGRTQVRSETVSDETADCCVMQRAYLGRGGGIGTEKDGAPEKLGTVHVRNYSGADWV